MDDTRRTEWQDGVGLHDLFMTRYDKSLLLQMNWSFPLTAARRYEHMSETSSKLPTRITPIVESRFGLDGGAMFGIIPRPLWSRTNPPDEQNRIEMTSRCLLVEYGESRRVLIDVGMGERWSEKEKTIYNVHAQDPALTHALSTHDLTPEQIDDVILTHLHFDHAGGLLRSAATAQQAQEEGVTRPAFTNATHWVQRRNWGWAHSPSARDGGSYRQEDFAWLAETTRGPKLNLVDGIAEILPGIEVLPQHGHTFGMQVVKITLESCTVVFTADLIPTSSHLRDPYVMGYDLQPLITVQEKRALLYEAARHDWIVCFEHDPSLSFARVEFDERDQPRCVPIGEEEMPEGLSS